jgi:hypothetical protein
MPELTGDSVDIRVTAPWRLPVITGVPTIAGTPTDGETLTATAASVTSGTAATRAWQWLRGGAPIAGATSDTYLAVEADVGFTLAVRQSETNPRGTVSATSLATAPVAAAITGTPAVISDLAWSVEDSRFSLSTDTGLGTILYVFTATGTPLTGAAIRAAVDGATLPGGSAVNDYGTQDFTITAPPAGDYYLQVVHETFADDELTVLYSNILVDGPHTVPVVFDPASLSGARIVVDVSDMGTLWQNTDGTNAVTASGQLVGSVTNRGSLGGLYVNSGGTDRPTYTEGSGLKYLQFDGSNDYLQLTHGSDVSLAGGFSCFMVLEENVANTNKAFAGWAGETSSSLNSGSGGRVITMGAADTAVRFQIGLASASGLSLADSTASTLARAIVEFECIPAAGVGVTNGWLRTEYAGEGAPIQRETGSTGLPGNSPDNATAIRRFTIGCELNGVGTPSTRNAFVQGRVLAYVLVAGAMTSEERDNLRAWCRTRAGF